MAEITPKRSHVITKAHSMVSYDINTGTLLVSMTKIKPPCSYKSCLIDELIILGAKTGVPFDWLKPPSRALDSN